VHEARGNILGVESDKSGVPAHEREQVELIGNETVVVGLDRSDVVRRDVGFGSNLLGGVAAALARLGEKLAETCLTAGAASSRDLRLRFSHLLPPRLLQRFSENELPYPPLAQVPP
jgi:hypothetical protein